MQPDIVVIDFETGSLKPEAVVYTFGAVRFNPDCPTFEGFNPDNQLYMYLDPGEQVSQFNRVIDHATRNVWWEAQSEEALHEIHLAETCRNPVALYQLIDTLESFLKPTDRVYARGQEFERDIIFSICKQLGRTFCRRFNQMYDVRTYLDAKSDGTFKLATAQYRDLISHHSLHDCIRDASEMYRMHQLTKLRSSL